MSTHEQASEDAVDDFVMPDDYTADFFAYRPIASDKLFSLLLHIFRDVHARALCRLAPILPIPPRMAGKSHPIRLPMGLLETPSGIACHQT
jgi:hypothetical protein